jgi:molecular chaperone DnaJ
MAEDLYSILNLNKGASDTEIKKAYRQMARKYHPDVNKDSGAEAKFKEIQKAYTILSDSQKKAQYDQFGVTDDSPSGAGGYSGFGGGGFEGGFEDIFDAFFGGSRSGGRSGRKQPRRGDDLRYDLELTLEDASNGVSKDIEIYHLEKCSRCKGSGAQPGTEKVTCQTCHGSGQVKTVQRTFLGSFSQVGPCPKCEGQGTMIKNPCLNCHGRGVEKKKKRIKVDIPAGVDSGTKLRVVGEGNQGEPGASPGDLYVFIVIKEHKYFQREDEDIYLELEMPFSQAVLGTEIEVPILGGHAILKIPSGTQPDTMFRLKGKGMPRLRGFGRGDEYVKVKLTTPKSLSGEEKKLIKEFAKLRKEDTSTKDIFSRVKKFF